VCVKIQEYLECEKRKRGERERERERVNKGKRGRDGSPGATVKVTSSFLETNLLPPQFLHS
jgi:hypothetical protein